MININRRQFLMTAGITATGALMGADTFAQGGFDKKRIGLQLYSLREEIPSAGLEAVLKKIAAAGYNSVEFYGFNTKDAYFKNSGKEVAALLKTNNMIAPSGHYDLKLFEKDGQQTVDAALAIGNKYVVVPYLTADLRKSLDDYKVIAEKLNKIALLCKQNNIKMAYHNHDFEFTKYEGDVCGYDILLKETDKALVNFELDLYWVVTAGRNPIELFEKNPGRFKMWHVKDKDKSNPKLQTEVGSGSIDFKPIFAKAKLAGLEYFYVEQENFAIPSDESIRKSIGFIKKDIFKMK